MPNNTSFPQFPKSVAVRPNLFAVGTGEDATIELPITQAAWAISGIEWSYSGTPTNGRVRVLCNGLEYINLDITAGGKDDVNYSPPLRFLARRAVQLILHSGGAAVTGKVRFKGYWLV